MIYTFYGAEFLIKNAEYNTPFTSEKIFSIKKTELKEIIQNFVNHIASLRMNEYDEILDELHLKLGGKGKINGELKQKILNNIAENNEPIGTKNSIENIGRIIATTMMEDYEAYK